MNDYDFKGFPEMGTSVEISESYAPSRYSMRFRHADLEKMSKADIEKTKSTIEKTIKQLEKEQDEMTKFDKSSYIIRERIRFEYQLLENIDEYLEELKNEESNKKREAEIEKELNKEDNQIKKQ